MTRTAKFLCSAGLIAAGTILAQPALAAGTTAGTTVTNSVTLSYKVANVSQPDITKTNSFTVDRKINLAVTGKGTTTTVVPGETQAVTTFTLTNSSNATLDFGLSASQLTNGTTAAHGGTDAFDVTGAQIYLDDGNGTFDAGDTVVTYIDELAEDAQKTIFVVATVPNTAANGDVAGVRLTATALGGGTGGAQGTTITQTTGANNLNGMDTVFADTNTSGTNTQYDGKDIGEDDYTVVTAALEVIKTSKVISDPINGTTNPKMIPGAVVEYCIIVRNNGDATATAINVSDTLPTATTYYSTNYSVKVKGTVDGSNNCTVGTDDGTESGGVVSGTLDNILAGDAKNAMFQVTVN